MSKAPGRIVKSNSKSFSCRYSRQFYFMDFSINKQRNRTKKKKKSRKKAEKGGRWFWVCENETNHIYVNNQNADFFISALQAFIS